MSSMPSVRLMEAFMSNSAVMCYFFRLEAAVATILRGQGEP